MAQELDQAQRRKPVILKDQWGRRWGSTIDIISQGTCAPINPQGWVDRLNTPERIGTREIKKLVQDEDGRLALFIDVDAWISELEHAHERYDKMLYDDAMMLFGTEGPKAYEERSPGLLNYTGTGPQALEPIYALKDENPWILGKTEVPDKRLTRFFQKQGKPRPSFRAEDRTVDPDELEEQVDPHATGGKKVPAPKKEKAVA